MSHHLLPSLNILNLSGATTGTAAATTSCVLPVNMEGYEGCLFIGMSATTGFGTAQDMFISECGTSDGTFVSLETGGGAVAAGAANTTSVSFLAVDVWNPKDQFLKVQFTSGTIGDLHRVVAIQYAPRKAPITQSTLDVAATTYNIYTPFVSGAYVSVASPSSA